MLIGALAIIVAPLSTTHAAVDAIIQAGDTLPGGGTATTFFGAFELNDAGQVLVSAGGAYMLYTGSELRRVLPADGSAPLVAGATVQGQFNGRLNSLGHVSFTVDLQTPDGFELDPRFPGNQNNDMVLYQWNGQDTSDSSYTVLIREEQFTSDFSGEFDSFTPSFYNGGATIPVYGPNDQPIVLAKLRGTAGGSADDDRLYRAAASGPQQIGSPINLGLVSIAANDSGAVTYRVFNEGIYAEGHTGTIFGSGVNEIVPGVGQSRSNAGGLHVGSNNAGNIAFSNGFNRLNDSTALRSNFNPLLFWDGTSTTKLLDSGTPIVGMTDRIHQVNNILMDGSDRIVFTAQLIAPTTTQTILTGTALMTYEDGAPRVLARQGDAAPGGGTFGSLVFATITDTPPPISLTGGGQTVFHDKNGTNAHFMTDGIDMIRLPAGVYFLGSGGEDGRRSGVNKYAQVAYGRSNDGVYLFTPDLTWRGTVADNAWDSQKNWFLSINPAHVHRVTIASDDALTVTGPTTDRTVRSLTLGGGDALAMLSLDPDAMLTVREGLVVTETGGLAFGLLNPSQLAAILVEGNVSLDGVLELDPLTSLGVGDSFELIRYSGTLTGMFASVLGGGYDWDISYDAGVVTATLASVPEPAGAVLIAFGSLFVLHRRRF